MRRDSPVSWAAVAAAAVILLAASWSQPFPVVAQDGPDTARSATHPPGTEEMRASAPEARLHVLVNRHRDSIGCRPLAWHVPSVSVAEGRSADMIARQYFDHRTPDGRTVFDEVADAGIEAWGSIAENIALSHAGPGSVLELWRDSPPHRRNLENCSFTHHGLGQRGGVWTQILLAQPKKAATPSGVSPSGPASPRR